MEIGGVRLNRGAATGSTIKNAGKLRMHGHRGTTYT